MVIDPLHQFEIKHLLQVDLGIMALPITNSAIAMWLSVGVLVLFFIFALRSRAFIPGRMQVAAEMLYTMTMEMAGSTAGAKSKQYVPFIFTLFLFILSCNLLGMLPFSFTATSHIAVTFGIAIFIFLAVTVIGFIQHGSHYLKLFLPDGVPMVMAPLLAVVEFFAYLTRPVSLSIRLAANMTAGHIVLKVLASFITMAGILGVFPLALLTILTGFEIFVAILQAYIFSILTCVYLNDALNMH